MKNAHHAQYARAARAGMLSVVLVLAASTVLWGRTLKAAPAPQDDAAAELLRQAARMIREAAAEASGSEKGCYLSWGGFVECQSRKLSNGGRGNCPRPSCDFGDPTLAQMLATFDDDEAAEAEASSPSLASGRESAGAVVSPSGAPRSNPSPSVPPNAQPAPRAAVTTATSEPRPAPEKARAANGGAVGRPGGTSGSLNGATTQRGSAPTWRLYQTYKNIDIYVGVVWESNTSFSIHWKGVNKNREPIDIRINYRVYGPRTYRGAPDYDWANTEFVMSPGGTNANSSSHGDFSSIRLIQITRIELFKGGTKSAGGAY